MVKVLTPVHNIFSAFTALMIEILRKDVLYCSILDTMEYYLRHIVRQQLLKHLAQIISWLPTCSTDLRFRQAPRGYVGLVHWLGTRVTCPSSHTSPSSPAL